MKTNGVYSEKYTIVPIESDGNCLFRCYSHFVLGDQNLFDIIRLLIVNHVASNWTNVQNFVKSEGTYGVNVIINNIADYTNYMSRSGTFGAEIEVAAFSYSFLSYCLVIYDYNANVINNNIII